MHFFTHYLPVIIGLTLLNTQAGIANPLDTTSEIQQLTADSFNITSVVHGFHSPEKRAGTPYPCNFAPRLSFSYTLFTTQQVAAPNVACFAWVPTSSCSLSGGQSWTGATTDDFQKVVAQQVTKDGQFKGSDVGAWSAAFEVGTTAYANRASASLFQWAFLSGNGAFGEVPSIFKGAGGKGQYMFAFNRDQMEVNRKLGAFGWGCQ